MPLFSVVFCVVTVVHKFHFRLVINEIPNKWRPVATSCSNRDSCFWQDLCFPHTIVARVKGLYPRSAGPLHSLLLCLSKYRAEVRTGHNHDGPEMELNNTSADLAEEFLSKVLNVTSGGI
jgi:hypothetical protein